jgi:hypothetical protein
MGTIIDCFMIERLNEAEASLRRFTYSDKVKCPCSEHWGHDASVSLGFVPYEDDPFEGRSTLGQEQRGDPRWPKTCQYCDYVFQEADEWQYNRKRLYIRRETGEKVIIDKAPPGSMWYADWMKEYSTSSNHQTPDGRFLAVMTPGGEWQIDGQSSSGGYWTRTGTPPKITATPSIMVGRNKKGGCSYHGFLVDGQLREC